jgi:hypothetical protein
MDVNDMFLSNQISYILKKFEKCKKKIIHHTLVLLHAVSFPMSSTGIKIINLILKVLI